MRLQLLVLGVVAGLLPVLRVTLAPPLGQLGQLGDRGLGDGPGGEGAGVGDGGGVGEHQGRGRPRPRQQGV